MANRQIVVDIIGDSKKFTKATDDAIKSTGKLDSAFAKFKKQGGIGQAILGGVGIGAGLGVFGAVTKGIGMVTDAMGDSIKAASDQAEAMSKVTVVFGDQADEIRLWAKSAATSMGMSQTAALAAAGTLGNLFDGLGIANDAGLKMSKTITQLAADLGSFNNVSTDDALLALRSGLLGEAEPMRKFGSALSAARVEAYGFANGLFEVIRSGTGTKRVMSEAQKVQARYALMLEDTKNAQGDFARTADGLANSQKSLDAALADLSVEMGKFLVGPAGEFIQFMMKVVTQGRTAGGSIQEYIAHQKELTEAAAGSVDPLNQMIDAFALLTAATDPNRVIPGDIAKRIIALGEASGQTATDVMDLWQLFRNGGDSIEEAGRKVTEFLLGTKEFRDKTSSYIQAWSGAWKAGTEEVEDATEGAGQTIGSVMAQMRSAIKRTMNSMNGTLAEAMDPWKTAWKNLAEYAKDPFQPARFENKMAQYARRAARKAAEAAEDGKPAVARRWRALANAAKDPVVRAMTLIGLSVDEALAAIASVRRAGAQVRGFFDFRIGTGGSSGGGGGGGGGGAHEQPTGHNAEGTSNWRGGMTWVGERGPELVNLPRGSSVLSNAQSMRAVGSGGSTVNVTINVPPTADMASVGRAVTQALRAYGQSGGIPAMKSAIGA